METASLKHSNFANHVSQSLVLLTVCPQSFARTPVRSKRKQQAEKAFVKQLPKLVQPKVCFGITSLLGTLRDLTLVNSAARTLVKLRALIITTMSRFGFDGCADRVIFDGTKPNQKVRPTKLTFEDYTGKKAELIKAE